METALIVAMLKVSLEIVFCLTGIKFVTGFVVDEMIVSVGISVPSAPTHKI